jgi:hypothetical protein
MRLPPAPDLRPESARYAASSTPAGRDPYRSCAPIPKLSGNAGETKPAQSGKRLSAITFNDQSVIFWPLLPQSLLGIRRHVVIRSGSVTNVNFPAFAVAVCRG